MQILKGFLIACLVCNGLFAQDTIKVIDPPSTQVKARSPKKACILSAILPGAGQIYNKKYWKVPLVYVAIGVPVWFAYDTHKEYKLYKEAYISRTDNDPATLDDFPLYTDSQLKENVDFYRRYRDMNFFLIGLMYALNIVDASVDAHLSTFNVSNDLSFHLSPAPYSSSLRPQLGFTLKF